MNLVIRIPRVFLLAGWLVVTLPSIGAAAADAGTVVPGQSLGSLRLGMPVTALYQAAGWGQPDRVHISGSISYMTYARQGVMVAIRDSAVVLILTTNQRHRTDKGVGVGQGASAATSAYGTPASGGDGRTLWYDAVGLVVVTGGGTIVRIGVYDPKTFVRAILADEQPARDVFLTARPPKYSTAVGDDAGPGPGARTAVVTVTLKNSSRGSKVLNPNFFTLADREGGSYRYHRTTFAQKDACRSTLTVPPGESKSCSLVFLVPTGRTARFIAYNDGGSLDEFYF
ncbi:MAG: hypothetical protein A2Z07_06665 [Armatimonadetes bacterium RBG_16_67_12]|nr:MAG: hypothetical protein A2Z07_06665 [Armatimonadetes bacterium RBG_16_67_12]